jgi:hypothetical protein
MKILVIDGLGGGMGRAILESCIKAVPGQSFLACGTNAAATTSMMKAGSVLGATGENAICYNCQDADIILGPIGLLIPNAMRGEISPAISMAVASSSATKILLPVTQCSVVIAGVTEVPIARLLEDTTSHLIKLLSQGS